MNKSYCYSWCSCTLCYRSSKDKGFFVLRQHHARGIVEHGVKFHALVNGSDSITEMSTRDKGGRCSGLTSPSCADCLEIQGAPGACPAVTGRLYLYTVEVTRIDSGSPTSWSPMGLSSGNGMALSVHGRSDQNRFPAPNKHKVGSEGRRKTIPARTWD